LNLSPKNFIFLVGFILTLKWDEEFETISI